MLTRFRYPNLRQGLLGHWRPSRRATGSALIDSVRGNHGGLLNGPTWVASGSGLALSFDGVNDFVKATEIPFRTSGLPNLTFGCWFRTANAGSSFRGLVVKQGEYGLFLNGNLLSAYDWAAPATQPSTSIACNDSLWHLALMACTPTTAQIYLDGRAVSASTSYRVGGSGWSNTTSLVFGVVGQVR